MAEVTFEYIAGKIEAVKGVAETAPDHLLALKGTITPKRAVVRSPNVIGSLAGARKTTIVQKWGDLAASGDLDIRGLPWLANMVLKPVSAPTTPTSAILARLWTFNRSIRTNDLKSATWWYGDPNQQFWMGKYGMINELTFGSTPTGTDLARMGISGRTHFPTQEATPAQPIQDLGESILPGWVQVWMDTSAPMGTTEIMGRVLNADHTIPTGVTYKYPGQGPASGLNYFRIGRMPTSPTTRLSLDMVDQVQYNLYEAGSRVKLRVRHNGPLIENIGGTLFYNYVQVDTWGTLDDLAWGNYEGNRTLDLTLTSEEDATAGTDFILYVQGPFATL